MTSKKGKWNPKYIVLIGYVLLVLILIVGLLFLYRNLVQFSERKERNEDFTELLMVGKTISKLYEVETHQNLINADKASVYFHEYDSILPLIYRNIDSLSSISANKERKNNLDSIKYLLNYKKTNLKAISHLMDSIKSPEIISNTESSYSPKRLSQDVNDYIKDKNTIYNKRFQTDTIKIAGRKKSFFERVKNVFNSKERDTTLVVEFKPFIETDSFRLIVDTVVNRVRYTEKVNMTKQMSIEKALKNRQLILIQINTELTRKIDDILKKIEHEEIIQSISLLEYKNAAISKSQKAVLTVSALAILIALLFGFLYFTDFNKGQKYRLQLEKSNAHVNQLLEGREKLMLAITHDIKAPMASILGYIELLDSNICESKKTMFLQNMRNSGEHIIQLVSNLLDFHSLKSGTWNKKDIEFNLKSLVDNTVNSFEPLAEKKRLQFLFENTISSKLIVYNDPYILRQIISNLVSNAVKFTREGFVKITASTLQKDEKMYCQLSVKDTGRGIDKKYKDLIFTEFRRVEHSLHNEFVEGSGLGLAITKALLNELDGTITLESEIDKGSEFLITLPILVSEVVEEADNVISQPKKINARYDFSGIQILLIDDDSVQLTMTSEMLKRKNAKIVTETNPERVLSHLKHQTFDLILMDIQMPKMNGFTLVNLIRYSEFDKTKTMPIIAISAKSDISKMNVTDVGFSDFLVKPFTSEQLYSMVHHYAHQEQSVVENKDEAETVAGISALIDFVKDDKPTSIEILSTFEKDLLHNIDDLSRSFADNEKEKPSQLAHKMLPLFKMIGKKDVVKSLSKLEKGTLLSDSRKERLLSDLNVCLKETRDLMEELERAD